MTNLTAAKTSPTISTTAAWVAMVAILTYQIFLGVLILLRPDLNPSWHSISEWAIGPHGWIMSGAFLISSVSYWALFAMIRTHIRTPAGRMGLGMLVMCATGAAGAGIFTTDPMPFHPPLSTTGTLHVFCGGSQLVLFPFAALLLGRSLAGASEAWAKARRILFWTAWLPLLGFASFAVYTMVFVAPMGQHAYGPGVNIGWPPRFAFFTYMLWIIIVGLQALKCGRESLTEGHSWREQMGRIPGANAFSQIQ